jgi:hypothetical protein
MFVVIGHKNARIGSGSGIRDYGSADSDPNLKEIFTDPQHWYKPGPGKGVLSYLRYIILHSFTCIYTP